ERPISSLRELSWKPFSSIGSTANSPAPSNAFSQMMSIPMTDSVFLFQRNEDFGRDQESRYVRPDSARCDFPPSHNAGWLLGQLGQIQGPRSDRRHRPPRPG